MMIEVEYKMSIDVIPLQDDGNEKGTTNKASEDEEGEAGKPDIVYVEDVGFNIKISVPGIEQFTVQVQL